MKAFIQGLKDRVLSGGAIAYHEAVRLITLEDPEQIDFLLESAHAITCHFRSTKPDLCSLVNAKSYLCSQDCGFCSQSSHYKTGVKRYPLMKPSEVLEQAKRCETNGIQSFCVVTSGETLNDAEFAQVLETFRLLKAETSLYLDGSLGNLTADQIRLLRDAGMRRFNHNLQCSREFYPEIVSTHTYDKRAETLDFLRENGVELCSGGILGMGETWEDRVQFALELKKYELHCLPVNILNPRPGTPLEGRLPIDPAEVVKAVAVFRFIHPQANIKLAGGRELNLGLYFQEKALRGGANGLVVGGYLTTGGNPLREDIEMLKRCGYNAPVIESAHLCCAEAGTSPATC
ncbi:MAG TPA: biotin synthase BioB [Candidatus Omnitrophota bacterium]|nr:biotin synthase BioB [Candidatus Omnitrophota bacterium]HPS36574.1 biotin synthase BioB [Candidatus Omnitrophota bacterium]